MFSSSRVAMGVLLTGGVLAACSPTFNWRELRLDGTPLQAQLPCKPESAERSVPLAGQATVLHMLSCQAGGLTFALAWADVGERASAAPALTHWRAASLQSLRVPPAENVAALQWAAPLPPGADAVQGVQAQGLDHAQQPVLTRSAYFSRGSQVFQAAVYGQRLDADAVEAFFAGLRLQP